MLPTLKALLLLQGLFGAAAGYRRLRLAYGGSPPVLSSLALLPLGLLPAIGLAEFDNWHAVEATFRKSAAGFLLVLCVIEALALYVCFGASRTDPRVASNDTAGRRNRLIWLGAATLSGAVLALRYDALFDGSSMLHWAYYVGPAEGIRHGADLLWDQPSQYGLLNVLLVSAYPNSSIWQSFYVVQALLLLACVLLVFRTIVAMGEPRAWVAIAFACWFVIFFFSDPALIGPQLYPSSSAMRFLPCYLLIALAAKPFRIGRYSLGPLAAWVLSLFWSVETAFYCSAAGAAFLVGRGEGEDPLRESIRQSVAWACTGAVALAAFTVVYRLLLGHWPDWTMYWMYAAGYGAGFDAFNVPFSPMGAWIFLLMLVAAMTAAGCAIRASGAGGRATAVAASATALAWALCSYYVGRPLFNNILALAPLLVFCALVVMSLVARTGLESYANPLRLALLPFIVMLMASTIGSASFYATVAGASSFTSDISSRLPNADERLIEVVRNIRLKPGESWVYYGDSASAPVLPGVDAASPWLPVPLQLLQEPIPEAQREKIFARRTARFASGGVFVYSRSGAAATTALEWIRKLDAIYARIDSCENADYGAIRFGAKPDL